MPDDSELERAFAPLARTPMANRLAAAQAPANPASDREDAVPIPRSSHAVLIRCVESDCAVAVDVVNASAVTMMRSLER